MVQQINQHRRARDVSLMAWILIATAFGYYVGYWRAWKTVKQPINVVVTPTTVNIDVALIESIVGKYGYVLVRKELAGEPVGRTQ